MSIGMAFCIGFITGCIPGFYTLWAAKKLHKSTGLLLRKTDEGLETTKKVDERARASIDRAKKFLAELNASLNRQG